MMKLKQFMLGFICLLLVSGVVGCCPAGPATPMPPSQSAGGIMEKLTIEELTARADSILIGEVTDITCYKGGGGDIYTQVTLSVEQTVKGETEAVVIRIAGGEVEGQKLWVEDTPRFQLRERVVVFLGERESILSVVGGFQGKFAIDKNNMVGGNIPLSEFIEQLRDIMAKH